MTWFNTLDFSNTIVLNLWIYIFILLNVIGFVRKNSYYTFITLLFSVACLIIHIVLEVEFAEAFKQNVLVDFIFMIISISLYLYVDEIESRREVISEVFENKYKKNKKK